MDEVLFVGCGVLQFDLTRNCTDHRISIKLVSESRDRIHEYAVCSLFVVSLAHRSLVKYSRLFSIITYHKRYLISDSVNKRTWAIIIGCVFSPIAFV